MDTSRYTLYAGKGHCVTLSLGRAGKGQDTENSCAENLLTPVHFGNGNHKIRESAIPAE